MQTEMFALFFRSSFCIIRTDIGTRREPFHGTIHLQQIKNLNELELLVYQYIIEHPNWCPSSHRELAAEAHVSTTTVPHFCKKVGCDGYAQFKWKLKEQAGSAQGSRLPDTLGGCRTFCGKSARRNTMQRWTKPPV